MKYIRKFLFFFMILVPGHFFGVRGLNYLFKSGQDPINHDIIVSMIIGFCVALFLSFHLVRKEPRSA